MTGSKNPGFGEMVLLALLMSELAYHCSKLSPSEYRTMVLGLPSVSVFCKPTSISSSSISLAIIADVSCMTCSWNKLRLSSISRSETSSYPIPLILPNSLDLLTPPIPLTKLRLRDSLLDHSRVRRSTSLLISRERSYIFWENLICLR